MIAKEPNFDREAEKIFDLIYDGVPTPEMRALGVELIRIFLDVAHAKGRMAAVDNIKSLSGQQIHHINGDPSDNRIENLRFVTASENHGHRRD